MKLYNSETRVVEEIVPYVAGQINLYTCGPTVYHFAHIGNLRSYIMEDILEKALQFVGYKVNRAMNITDVGHLSDDGDAGEDKMLLGAKREGKSVLEIADEYTQEFKKDMAKLKLKWPDTVVPATSMIDDYIKMITTLLEKGFAYQSNGNIYFDTSKLSEYYRFGNQGAEDLIVGAREDVGEDEHKKNPNDFVLWFTKSKFENQALKWDSPWGVGYPGWHIECSAISLKCLGDKLDIHCGGVDNKFPHHTNEIAQTESYVGHKWCKYWFHVGHLNTKNGKMSKSSGEFLTLTRLAEKGYSPLVYKFFCLQSHYRKNLLFSDEALDSAKIAYTKLLKRIAELKDGGSQIDNVAFEKFVQQFKDALENDLNTSLAITTVFDVLKADCSVNTKIALVREFDKVLDLDFVDALAGKVQDPEKQIDEATKQYIEEQIKKRKLAKQQKDFATADAIRKELTEKGIELIDTKDGTTYKLV